MEELRFRAWFHKTGQGTMFYSPTVTNGLRPRVHHESKAVRTWTGFWSNIFGFEGEVTVMQWTGLQDMNGQDIYEGDIVVMDNQYPFSDDDKPNYVGVVEWVFAAWQYVLCCVNSDRRGTLEGMNTLLDDDGEGGRHFRVIGNILQNQELIVHPAQKNS